MSLVYVALGSNLGVPENYLSDALALIETLPTTENLKVSPWYVSAAIGGPKDQPDYLNAVCVFDTQLDAESLLASLQNIENQAGRKREIHWGPRTLDLDIIWYENTICTTETLILPHPRAHLRAFVVKPLLDLNATITLNGQSLTELASQLTDQKIRLR